LCTGKKNFINVLNLNNSPDSPKDEGLNKEGISIRENYHPLTGKRLNAEHFSWSAAHLILLLSD
tara:strand:+ start:222 stop:413 length:192 start_codon:yes stop_codon:yes gene_type:complete